MTDSSPTAHAADGALAPALHDGLRRLAKPWNRRSALHIFHNQTGLSTSPHLWSSIERALDSANWFVLLASPEAAQSEWVNRELAHWLAGKARRTSCPSSPTAPGNGRPGSSAGLRYLPCSPPCSSTSHVTSICAGRAPRPSWTCATRCFVARSPNSPRLCTVSPRTSSKARTSVSADRVRRLDERSAVGLVILLIMALAAATFAVAQRNRADEAAGTAREQATEARRPATIANAERLSALALAEADTSLDQALLLAAEGIRLHDNVSRRAVPCSRC